MTEEQINLMKHAIGMKNSEIKVPDEPYRNYFMTYSDTCDFLPWQSLVETGHATREYYPLAIDSYYFHVTDKGKEAIKAWNQRAGGGDE